ncbi:NUMOD4 domain-containing protein [Brevibacillus laterosporus]|uniref:NUMOD4 domain-containing protein n=1 Tax=Brevibacillus laterosporus TaxID=1465 RepID=UPI003D199D6E
MGEEWKPILGYEGSYEVSNTGRVRSVDRYTRTKGKPILKRGVEKTKKEDKDGYYRVWLSRESKKKSFFVHRLVAIAFLSNPESYPVVNHKDGDKKNNHVTNLEWCSHAHNVKHAFSLGLRVPHCGGTSKPVAKMHPVTEEVISTYPSISEAARQNGVTTALISYCVNGGSEFATGYRWKFVNEGVTTTEITPRAQESRVGHEIGAWPKRWGTDITVQEIV